MPSFHDPSGRGASTRALRIRGLIVAVVVTVAATGLSQLATGRYHDTFKLTVLANTIGEGLAPGAEVKFHGLAIGTVTSLESAGYNKQRMTVELDPRQAAALTADTQAQFTSSNVFGSAVVELVSGGVGPRLRPNQTLVMGAGVQAASITGLLRQGQRIGQIVDSPDVNHIVAVLRRHGDLTEPVAKSIVDFAKILADAQTVPFSQTLAVMAGLVNGLNDFVPLVGLLNELLDGLQFLGEPGGAQRTTDVLHQAGRLLGDVGGLLAKHLPWLVPLVASIMNLSVPSAYLFGSLAPSYDRLSGLLDRTSAAFPFQDGRVRMQIEVILDAVPGLAAALPPAPGGGR
ncbi:MlaD family protein [Mycobacterium sp. pUA109]|uniref:MlaD family protein n=1 Tax=Mycobacterium sp. pUA109 TaxID=3238982 RepID=UPI00351B18EE